MPEIQIKLDAKSESLIKLFPKVVQPASEELTVVVANQVRTEVKQSVPNYVGNSKLAMRRIKGGRSIVTPLHVLVLDQGRRPGAPPPPSDVIESWARRRIGQSGLGFVIARSIGRRGIKPRRFFRKAARTVLREQNIPRAFANIMRRKLRGN